MANEPIIPDDLMNTSDVAKLLNVTSMTIRRWIESNKLPAFRVGSRLRVSRADALAFVQRVETGNGLRLETRAEVAARDAETDRVLRAAGVRK